MKSNPVIPLPPQSPSSARRPARVLFCALLSVLIFSSPVFPLGGHALAREGSAGAPGSGQAADLKALFEKLRVRQASARSFRATLVQRHRSPLLPVEAVTEGRILFEKSGRFRWEARTPERRLVVSDGSVLTDYFPDRKEAERMDARDPLASRMIMQFMGSGMGQPLSELEKRFRVELAWNEGTLVATLTPRSGFLLRVIRSISVSQREEDGIPSRIVMLGPKGDRVETVLRDVELDPPLPPDAFTLKLGPGVRLFDAIERKARGEDAP